LKTGEYVLPSGFTITIPKGTARKGVARAANLITTVETANRSNRKSKRTAAKA
jgi:hypothetical protein